MAETTATGQATTQPAGETPTSGAAAAAPAAGAAGAKSADQTGAGSQAGAAADGGKAGVTPKAPEKYELTIPHGAEAFMDQADLDAFAKEAKANDWTQDEAVAVLEAQADQVAGLLVRLRTETEKDTEYGGDKLEASKALAQRVIDRFRPKGHARAESFARFLQKTGAGSHIELFSLLADIGKAMAEDKPGAPGTGTPPKSQKTVEEVLYGS